MWEKMRTAALETAPQIVLGSCSKEVVGKSRSIYKILVKSSVQSSTYFTRDFLLVTRS